MSNIFEQALNDIPEDIQKDVSRNFDVIDRIRYIMSKKGLTQHDLANSLGENELEISKWMRGTHDFTLSTIRRIEEKLGERILFIAPPGEEIKKSGATSNYHLSVTYDYFYLDIIICTAAKKDQLVKKFVGKMEYSIN
jgi:transcriptional regulator with XRE-family HTH domain